VCHAAVSALSMEIGTELLEACLAHSRSAQERLYQQCYSELMQICYRYAKSKEEAMELLNIAFLKILKQLDKFKVDQSFGAWMQRVAINSIIDHYRSEKQYRATIVSVDTQQNWGEDLTPITATIAQIDYDYLIALIRALPPVTAHVFNLFAVDGYKHHEIAEKLHISENTSKWHVAEARKKLQRQLLNEKEKNHARRRI